VRIYFATNFISILSYLIVSLEVTILITIFYKIIYTIYIMTLSGGKRKINKSLKAWVTFVKRVQKEEKLSYKDAIHRAKQRKDKGEKWMKGGDGTPMDVETEEEEKMDVQPEENLPNPDLFERTPMGGRRRRGRRTVRRSRGRSRRRASRRH
jgi:hypothetical protein